MHGVAGARPPTSSCSISRTSARTTRARCGTGASGSSRNLGKVRELGYTDSFVRLWEYYLCYCEGGFIERQLGTVQMLADQARLPSQGAGAYGSSCISARTRALSSRAVNDPRLSSDSSLAGRRRASSPTRRAPRRCCATIARCTAAMRSRWWRRPTPRPSRACSPSAMSTASAWCPQGGNTSYCGGATPDASSSQVLLSLARLEPRPRASTPLTTR